MHRLLFGLLSAATTLVSTALSKPSLEQDFATPPVSTRPWVWSHWLHGNVDKPSITRQLEAMQRAGIGGMTLFDVAQPGIPAGPNPYLSTEWQELFAWQIREATRLGLETMSHNGPGYSGNGGPWITPEFAAQKIVDTATQVPGGRRFHGTLPRPHTEGGFYRDVALLAVREATPTTKPAIDDFDMKRLVWLNYIRWKGTRSAPLKETLPADRCIPREQVIDLTKKMSPDGTLRWVAPPGHWTLLRIGHTWTGQKTLPATPEALGPECDKLDKRGIGTHFDHVMRRMIRLAGPSAGKTFHGFFVDSWEAGGQNWTERMPEEFLRRRGYEITPYLPILTGRVVSDLQTSERFLYDLRQTVSELVAENFWAEMHRLCREHDLKLAVQAYITTGHDLDAARHCDEPTGEFWSHPFQPNDYSLTIKAAASTAKLMGKSIVGAEAFTASETERWLAHPATLKPIGDRAFCLGANRLQIHRFAMQRFPQAAPGMTMGKWGQHYDSTQTWWEWSQPWHDYLARCQLMLRQGRGVADVLALVPEEPLHRFEHKPIPGHDYDACGPENFQLLEIRDGLPALPGQPGYPLLSVDHHGTMTLARLQKLHHLVKEGAALLGEPPLATPGLSDLPRSDIELKALAAELWGHTGEQERRFGKGRVFRGISAAEALRRLGIQPDFTGPPELGWTHRSTGELDLYFLAAAGQPAIRSCEFRVTGKRAELWDPESGTLRPLDITPSAAGRVRAAIPFGHDGSAFVVFRPGPPLQPSITAASLDGRTLLPTQAASPTALKASRSFTYACWIKPETDIELPAETPRGFASLSQRRNDAIFPPPAHRLLPPGHAFSGLSVGRNGVVIHEHAGGHFPALLVHPARIDRWTHVAVSYHDNQPTLYLNGRKVRTGLKGPFEVHCPIGFEDGNDSIFRGQLGRFDAFAPVLDEPALRDWIATGKPLPDDRRLPVLPLETIAHPDGSRALLAHAPGRYDITFSDGSHHRETVNPAPLKTLTGPWTLSFPADSGIARPLVLTELISWSRYPDPAVRHFSGIASYQTRFTLPNDQGTVLLDLGRVEVMAKVRLNGRELGTLWKAPYRIDLTKALIPGENLLEISVVNLWVNRLIGDAALPEDSPRDPTGVLTDWPKWLINGETSPTGRRSFVTFPLWKKNEPLRPSGLLGPVVLSFPKELELR